MSTQVQPVPLAVRATTALAEIIIRCDGPKRRQRSARGNATRFVACQLAIGILGVLPPLSYSRAQLRHRWCRTGWRTRQQARENARYVAARCAWRLLCSAHASAMGSAMDSAIGEPLFAVAGQRVSTGPAAVACTQAEASGAQEPVTARVPSHSPPPLRPAFPPPLSPIPTSVFPLRPFSTDAHVRSQCPARCGWLRPCGSLHSIRQLLLPIKSSRRTLYAARCVLQIESTQRRRRKQPEDAHTVHRPHLVQRNHALRSAAGESDARACKAAKHGHRCGPTVPVGPRRL